MSMLRSAKETSATFLRMFVLGDSVNWKASATSETSETLAVQTVQLVMNWAHHPF